MRIRRVLWSLLTIAICISAGLCRVFLVVQRSFISMPTPVTPAHAAAPSLEVPGAMLRISAREHDGSEALVYFGGNAEDVAYTVPELAAAFPDRAIYALHYRGASRRYASSRAPEGNSQHRLERPVRHVGGIDARP